MVFKRMCTVALAFSLVCSATQGVFANSVAVLPEDHDQVHESIMHIDDQIVSMTRLKNYYMAKSIRYRNRATRIRFQSPKEKEDESDKLAKQADEYDGIVKKLNIEISKLENQRRRLEKKLT